MDGSSAERSGDRKGEGNCGKGDGSRVNKGCKNDGVEESLRFSTKPQLMQADPNNMRHCGLLAKRGLNSGLLHTGWMYRRIDLDMHGSMVG